MKVIALDVGTKTIGVAIGWTTNLLTQPLVTLKRKSVKNDSQRIYELCLLQKIEQIVVGLPFELDGKEGRAARLARQVGERLAEVSQIPVAYQDEQFSTVEAEKRLLEAGKNGFQRKALVDQVAAMVILEDWFSNRQ